SPQARFALGQSGSSEFLTGRVKVQLNHGSSDPTKPLPILAITDGILIDAQTVYLGVGLEAHGGPPEPTVSAGLTGGRFVLSADAAVVRGGGYLFFDPDRAQYAGVLHLEFEKLTLNAFGLLTTRLPDGSPGFSLLIIVQASGFTPIQLGFGFTLNGVGGLLGINRTVAVDVLRAGVRDRTLDAIMFSP